LYPPRNISSVYLTSKIFVRGIGRITNGMRCGQTTTQNSTISFCDTGTHSPGMTLPRTTWARLNRLRTGVGRFRSFLYKWGMVSSSDCKCGAEEQTVDYVILQCPIHRPPHGLHGLTVLDDETTEWLLNICPESRATKQWFEQLGQNKKKQANLKHFEVNLQMKSACLCTPRSGPNLI